jgi:hypothetical protein
MSHGAAYHPAGEIVVRDVAGETLLVPVRGRLADLQRIFSLNRVGACIWRELEGGKTLPEVRDTLVARYEVSPTEAAADLEQFVEQALAAGLLERTTP